MNTITFILMITCNPPTYKNDTIVDWSEQDKKHVEKYSLMCLRAEENANTPCLESITKTNATTYIYKCGKAVKRG